jgi:hypothetical protein
MSRKQYGMGGHSACVSCLSLIAIIYQCQTVSPHHDKDRARQYANLAGRGGTSYVHVLNNTICTIDGREPGIARPGGDSDQPGGDFGAPFVRVEGDLGGRQEDADGGHSNRNPAAKRGISRSDIVVPNLVSRERLGQKPNGSGGIRVMCVGTCPYRGARGRGWLLIRTSITAK